MEVILNSIIKGLIIISFIISSAFIFILESTPKACLHGKRKGEITRDEILKRPILEVLNNKYDRFEVKGFEMYFLGPGMDVWEATSKSDSLTENMIYMIRNKIYPHSSIATRIWFERINIIDKTSQKQYLDTLYYFELK